MTISIVNNTDTIDTWRQRTNQVISFVNGPSPLIATTVKLQDYINPSHYLTLRVNEDLTGDRILNIITGDTDRTLTLNGNATITGSNTGDQTITLTGAVTGTGTGTFSTTLADSLVGTPGTYGDTITIPAVTVNQKGLITGISNQAFDRTKLSLPSYNGIENSTGITITYDNNYSGGTNPNHRKLTLTIAGNVYAYVNGVRYTLTTQTIAAHPDASGMYVYYFNSSGVLTISTVNTIPDFGSTAWVATVLYNADATVKAGYLWDERHPAYSGMSNATHYYLHNTRGSVLVSGGAISGYTLNAAGATNLAYAVAGGTLADEDLYHTINPVAKSGPYTIVRRSGTDANGEFVSNYTSVTGILDNGTDIYYNQNNAGTWQMTAVTANNRWVNYWVCMGALLNPATGGAGNQIFIVMGQNLFTTLADATGSDFSTLSMGNLPVKEFVVVAKMTYQRVSGSSPSNAQLVSVMPIRQSVSAIISGVSPSDHQSLSNRNALACHPATSITVDASGFDGKLTTSDDTVQKIAQKLDDLIIATSTTGTFTSANLTANKLTITHNKALSAPYGLLIQFFDANGKQIVPDVDTAATNSCIYDFTNITVTGTCSYIYI